MARDFEFSNGSDRIDVGTWNLTGSALTLFVRCRLESFGQSDARLFSKAVGTGEGDHDLMLSTQSGSQLRFRLRTSDGGTDTLISPNTLTLGVDFDAVIRYDGTTMDILKDGVQIASTGKTGTLAFRGISAFWGNNPTANRALDGILSDGAIWPLALRNDEALAITNGVNPARIRPGQHALLMPMYGANSPEPDYSGNQRNGIVTGTSQVDHSPSSSAFSFDDSSGLYAVSAGNPSVDLIISLFGTSNIVNLPALVVFPSKNVQGSGFVTFSPSIIRNLSSFVEGEGVVTAVSSLILSLLDLDVNINGSSSLTSASSITLNSAIAMRGTASISAISSLTLNSSSEIIGEGLVTFINSLSLSPLDLTVNVNGTSSLTSVSSLTLNSVEAIQGVANIDSSNSLVLNSAIQIVGESNLSASTTIIKNLIAFLDGLGDLSSVNSAIQNGSSSIQSIGTLSSISSLVAGSSVSITGIASVSSIPQIGTVGSSRAAIVGEGIVSALPVNLISARIAIAGTSDLAQVPDAELNFITVMTGAGDLKSNSTLSVTNILDGTIQFSGTSEASPFVSLLAGFRGQIAGSSSVFGFPYKVLNSLKTITGRGNLTELPFLRSGMTSNFQGEGILFFSSEASFSSRIQMAGSGNLTGISDPIGIQPEVVYVKGLKVSFSQIKNVKVTV